MSRLQFFQTIIGAACAAVAGVGQKTKPRKWAPWSNGFSEARLRSLDEYELAEVIRPRAIGCKMGWLADSAIELNEAAKLLV